MKNTCIHCQAQLIGRTDKKFCNIKCKNDYNNVKRKETDDITDEIDGYLHRNRIILATLMGNSKREYFDKIVLTRAGFRFDYLTGIYLNKEGKTYHLVYDYAWMLFSTQQVMIVRK
jgi:hypothetical protein